MPLDIDTLAALIRKEAREAQHNNRSHIRSAIDATQAGNTDRLRYHDEFAVAYSVVAETLTNLADTLLESKEELYEEDHDVPGE